MKNKIQNNKEIILSIQLGFLAAGFVTDSVAFFIVSILIGLLSNLFAKFEKTIAFCWLFIGKTIGVVTKTILLTLVYFFILTPLGLLKRLISKDNYFFNKAPSATSWQSINKTYKKEDLINPW